MPKKGQQDPEMKRGLLSNDSLASEGETTPHSSAKEIRKDRFLVLLLLNFVLLVTLGVAASSSMGEAKLFTFEWTERLYPGELQLLFLMAVFY